MEALHKGFYAGMHVGILIKVKKKWYFFLAPQLGPKPNNNTMSNTNTYGVSLCRELFVVHDVWVLKETIYLNDSKKYSICWGTLLGKLT